MILVRLLPYDDMLRELDFELPSMDRAEPAAIQFYRKVGNQIIQSAQSTETTSNMLGLAQSLLSVHLYGRHAEIWKAVTLLQDFPYAIGKKLPGLSHNDELNGGPRRTEGRSSSTSDSNEPPGPLRKSQQNYDDYLYTSALKEMGENDGFSPHYTSEQVCFQPPKWRVTVLYRDFQFSAEASSKKAAKHSASKSMWLEMGENLLGN